MIVRTISVHVVALTLILPAIISSVFSAAVICHFHVQTRRYQRLRDFNSLWHVRILLVLFSLFASLAELARILGALGVLCCRAALLVSQGLLQPAFVVLLLFLLRSSLHMRHRGSILAALAAACIPALALQTVFIFFSGDVVSWVSGNQAVVEFFGQYHVARGDLCIYPLFSALTVGAFGAVYVACFSVVCCRTAERVINRWLRVRICVLAWSVLYAVPVQAFCLVVCSLWQPEEKVYDVLSLVGFSGMMLCVVVSQWVLVVRPIMDVLAVGGETMMVS